MLTLNTRRRSSPSTTTSVAIRIVVFLSMATFVMIGTSAAAAQTYGGDDIDIRNSNERMDDLQEMALKTVEDHHNRRMAKLEELIKDRRRRLSSLLSSSSSSSPLHDERDNRVLSSTERNEERDKTQRQLDVFERKLQHLKQTNTRGHHLERLEELRSLDNDERNSVHFLKM